MATGRALLMVTLIWSMSKIVIRDCLRPVILMMFTWMSLCALASSWDASKRLFTGSSHSNRILPGVNVIFFPSPSGLTFTTDKILSELLADMQRWKNKLPDHLKFKGPDSPQNAGTLPMQIWLLSCSHDLCLGLLHLLYSCVCMMFWRVFMRISYSCPLHLKFGLTVEQWSELIQLTSESIDWLDAHERVYDVWLLVAYAATCCALVQVYLGFFFFNLHL